MLIAKKDLESLRNARANTPHGLLGMHVVTVKKKSAVVVRVFVSDARSCEIVDIESEDGPRYPLDRLSDDGFFEGVIEDRDEVFKYRIRVETEDLEIRQFYDPYSLRSANPTFICSIKETSIEFSRSWDRGRG